MKPAAASKATPEEPAAGKGKRPAAIKEQPAGEVGAVPTVGTRSTLTTEERGAARANRKASMAVADKAGELPKSGEVFPSK